MQTFSVKTAESECEEEESRNFEWKDPLYAFKSQRNDFRTASMDGQEVVRWCKHLESAAGPVREHMDCVYEERGLFLLHLLLIIHLYSVIFYFWGRKCEEKRHKILKRNIVVELRLVCKCETWEQTLRNILQMTWENKWISVQ